MLAAAEVKQTRYQAEASLGVACARRVAGAPPACSATVRDAMEVLARLARERSSDSETITLSALQAIIDTIAKPCGPLNDLYARSMSRCKAAVTAAELDKRRDNALARILLTPAEPLFDAPATGIGRGIIPRLVSALGKLIPTDLHQVLQRRATLLASAYRGETGVVDWDGLIDSEEARDIALAALVAVAHSFRRFEVRKDWLLVILNTNPAAAAVGSNAFVLRNAGERSRHTAIGDVQFAVLMYELLSVAHPSRFSRETGEKFEKQFGQSPQVVFGNLFVELVKMRDKQRC